MWQRHWWNRRWGRAGRRDLYLYKDPWRVVARVGGPEGVSTVQPVVDEAAALDLARQWMDTDDEWRELTVR